jgi:hypothetical protein
MGQTEITGHYNGLMRKNGEWNVVDFACAKSRHVVILHNLTNMRRKASASFGLCLDRVPVAYHRYKKDFPWQQCKSSRLIFNLFCDNLTVSLRSCLAHVINLGTQVLISTYSKSPHYGPHDPKAHEPDTSKTTDRDEIGLVWTICVKVCSVMLQIS